MQAHSNVTCTAFVGHRLIASGPLSEVVLATKQALDAAGDEPVLIFNDRSSRQVEIDFRGTPGEVLARLSDDTTAPPAARGPGRPKLGVVAREVTLLPRHWDWLATQPGGASAALRRLVEDASRGNNSKVRAREASEAVDRFMQTMTGDFPGHEEASRAFWRKEAAMFEAVTAPWPVDVRDHLRRLAAMAWDEASGTS
ncbi:DUF2239 family protein [Dyella tabacisoli]|uniref:DUF2239 family protein n=1 Tax=Dyella tabacisoli TaxID=2282381 RepID=A0A369UK00_9GAMM|nr:DUF2239 family protein [Dyella tabacisoli]RDD80861.1 DUF2239 family protein [Dyella tabacisoli]